MRDAAPQVSIGATARETGPSEEQERLMQKKRAVFLALVSAATLGGAGAFAVHAQSTKVISS